MKRAVKRKFSHRKFSSTRIGLQVRALRKAKGLTLNQLSGLSGVSTAMLSKIERDQRNPTIGVLWGIAEALGVSLSQLLGLDEPRRILRIPRRDRKVIRDAETGFERHVLSPAFPTRGVDFLLCVLPPGGQSGVIPPHQDSVEEYLVTTRGSLIVRIGSTRHLLRKGDALYYDATTEHEFINTGRGRCEFYVVIHRSR